MKYMYYIAHISLSEVRILPSSFARAAILKLRYSLSYPLRQKHVLIFQAGNSNMYHKYTTNTNVAHLKTFLKGLQNILFKYYLVQFVVIHILFAIFFFSPHVIP